VRKGEEIISENAGRERERERERDVYNIQLPYKIIKNN
jgi:hypothetical protein